MSSPLILIVEDDANSRKLLRDVLGIVGYQTIEAGTAEEGIRLAVECLPALILMDIRLPGISGIEALQQLRDNARTHAIPVVAVTASVMHPQTAQALGAGFDALEPKPVRVDTLIGTVRQLLERSAQSQTI
jgi:two-component system, cell cycle response regulator DivK